MAAIEIKDLEVRQELDKKAMAMIFGGVAPTLPAGWTLTSSTVQKSDAGQIWVPSTKKISGVTEAYEFARVFENVTTITAQYTEYTVK
ncbi:MAG: hypothetical protein HC887_09190 [Desulfobacteraceae bacterium]|nr:hypothetical protein [Desulfobacteraceae bacterium]